MDEIWVDLEFWGRVVGQRQHECWAWTGPHNGAGYPDLRWYEGRICRAVRAHRVMYERVCGVIPDRHVVDHICNNKGCVNPDHLQAVPTHLNTRLHYERKRQCLTSGSSR